MGIIRFAINNPVKVTVMVLLLSLFGFLALFSIPIQLTPNVDRPLITVTTTWLGASPQEIEDNIVRRQEEKLKSVTDLVKMTSTSRDDRAQISLEFSVGVDKDVALREVSDKLRQVSGYQDRESIDEPIIEAADTALANPIAWLMFSTQDHDPTEYQDFAEDNIQPLLERVPGVASAQVLGGRQREVHIIVDPAKLAARRVTFRQLEQALRAHNIDISAGTSTQGKRDLSIRTTGKYETTKQVLNTVIVDLPGGPVYVRDVAQVENAFKKPVAIVRTKGRPVLAVPVRRETGANVLTVMTGLKAAINKINNELLTGPYEFMKLIQVYDETIYINSAIALVEQNIILGGILAILVLMLFLRSPSATLIVAVSIPISVIGTFLVVTMLGRNLNVVMLAGMAFAVGMVVDAAVVVLENIYRHAEMGKTRAQAALDGAREVWGAVLAGALTTMAVFLPILTIQEEAGQLFRDIAVAIASAVGLSLIVAVTVIPTLSARLIRQAGANSTYRPLRTALQSRRFLLVAAGPIILIPLVWLLASFKAASLAAAAWSVWLLICALAYVGHRPQTVSGGRFAGWLARCVAAINSRIWSRVAVVVGLTTLSIYFSWVLIPPQTYLPSGNRNLVFGLLLPPPGYSLDEFDRLGRAIETQIQPYWQCQLGSPQHQVLSQQWQQAYQQQIAPGIKTSLAQIDSQITELRRRLKQAPDPRQRHTLISQIGNLQQKQGMMRMTLGSMSISPPPIQNFFYVAFYGRVFMGAISQDENVVSPVANLFNLTAKKISDVYAIFFQPSIFGLRRPGASLDVDIRGDDLEKVTAAAGVLMAQCAQRFGGRPEPSPPNFARGRQETRFRVHQDKAKDLGMTVRDVGFIARAAVDGAIVGEFRQAGKTVDLTVKLAGTADRPPNVIEQIPICTPAGRIIPLGSIIERTDTTALQQINHIEEQRSVTLTVNAPEGIALQTLQENIQEMVTALRQDGTIHHSVLITYAGNADKLQQTRNALIGEWTGFNAQSLLNMLSSRFFIAVLVIFLLMAALFESFLYPFVIMFSVPLAAVGGFAGLRAAFMYSVANPTQPLQQFDVLTALGFIILLGVVVNNAILIVHQALNNMRDAHMPPHQAITESVRTRIRPIFMTSLTSIFGLGPLCLRTGAGSELYRGLGSVIVGGLLFSSVFTIFLVPALFSLTIAARNRIADWLRPQPSQLDLQLQPETPARTPERS